MLFERRLFSVVSILALTTASPALAQSTSWTGATSTDWFDAGNWNNGVPASIYTTIDTNSPNATVVEGASTAQTDYLLVGKNNTGTLTIQNGGNLTSYAGYIGMNAGSQGAVTVDGIGSTWTASAMLFVGATGAGTLTIRNGGTVSNGIGVIANQGDASSVWVDGAGSTWTNSDYLSVGNLGNGTLTITNGGSVTSDTAFVGQQTAGTGSVTVDGAGSSWSTTNTVYLGSSGNGKLTISNGGTVSAADVMLGAFGGSGTLIIGAASGQTAVAPGTLNAATIENGAGGGTIVFNHTSANYTFAPLISNGVTVEVDHGTTILTAANTYSGATTINGGVLTVAGSIANSAVTVNTGGVLNGAGVVGATQVNAGGTFAPGSGVAGTSMTVNGSLAFQSGAVYAINITPATSSFATVTGVATLGGATVNANYASGSYISKQYTILTAASISGTFGSLVNTSLPANFTSSLSYDLTSAYLNLTLNFVAPTAPGFGNGLSANQQYVANTLVNYFNTTGGIPAVFGALTSNGLTRVSGETATGSQQATFDAMTQFMGIMTDPFSSGRDTTAPHMMGYAATSNPTDAFAMFAKAPPKAYEPRWNVWAAGFGGSRSTDGNGALGSNSTTARIYGTAVGADYRFSPATVAGFSMAGGGSNFSVANGGSGHSDLVQAGAFVRHSEGSAYIVAAAAYGWQSITTDRIVAAGVVDRLHAAFDANAYSGRVEGGNRWLIPALGGVGVTPYAAVQVTAVDLPAYAETSTNGVGTFGLTYGAKTVTDTRSELGFRSDKSFALSDALLTLRGRAAWAHDFNADRSIAATFQSLPGASFTVNGAQASRDAALTSASAETSFGNGFSLAATFDGEFSDTARSYAGKGVVRYAW